MNQNIPVLVYIQKLKCIKSILVDIKPASVAHDIALTKITEFLKECEHKDNESKYYQLLNSVGKHIERDQNDINS